MRFSRTTLGLLLAVATAGTAKTTASIISSSTVTSTRTTTSKFGLEKKSSPLFGIHKLPNRGDVVASVPRGGATAADVEEGSADDDEEDKPKVLYLPGLLEATVAKKSVGVFFLVL